MMRHNRRPYTPEDEERYDSLSSLGRLVETDIESVLRSNRRQTLPGIDVTSLASPRRNSSKVTDLIHDLTTARRKLIERLVPDVSGNVTSRTTSSDDVEQTNPETLEGPERSDSPFKFDIVINTNGGSSNQVISAIPVESDDTDILADTINSLRDRMAKFEEKKRKSIHADDFQQYLGARYLEMYKQREKNPQKQNVCHNQKTQEQPSHISKHDHSLNAKIHGLARTHNDRSAPIEADHQAILPPIEKQPRRRRDMRCRMYKSTGLRTSNGMFPIYNDLEEAATGDGTPRRPRGIPGHTERRAKMRYIISHGLHSILAELRRTATTSQKSEQERLVDALDDND